MAGQGYSPKEAIYEDLLVAPMTASELEADLKDISDISAHLAEMLNDGTIGYRMASVGAVYYPKKKGKNPYRT